ncbi:MAG: hypothetical protein IPP49_14140 [Saprospiraceae bacterium]|nr:hypothetical protein [Saprospiraceae bacterium]
MMGIILLSSCNATRFLKEDQSLLKRTKIVFKNEKNKQDRLSVENELLTFIDQKPNDKLLFFIPKEYIYLVNSQPANNHWLGKGLKGLGEPPILYSEDASKKIAANMQKHLRFKKGFYEAKVDFLVDDKKSKEDGVLREGVMFGKAIPALSLTSYLWVRGTRSKVLITIVRIKIYWPLSNPLKTRLM